MFMDILAGILVLFLTFVYIHNKKDPKKLFEVYSQPGKWYFLKYPLFLMLLVLRRLRYYVNGKKLYNEAELDKRQPLSEHPLAFDAIFFHAISQDGIFLAAGAERRHANIINGLLYIKHPDLGLLKSLKLPETRLAEAPEGADTDKEWAIEGGPRYIVLEPMKKWKMSYNGKMRVHGSEELVDIEFDAEWFSEMPWFFYDVDLPAKMLARSVARETWSKELFENLKEAHQVHYEQMGYLNGTIKANGKILPLKLDAFRDHSYGRKRDWNLMHRYIFQMLYLENQCRLILGLVSQPCTASHYEMGYVVLPNGKIDAIEECDLKLWQHGESGNPSEELGFVVVAGKHTYECKVQYETTVAHYVGNNVQVKMYERFGTCEVNGIHGKVIAEWNYSNTNGKFKLDQYHC